MVVVCLHSSVYRSATVTGIVMFAVEAGAGTVKLNCSANLGFGIGNGSGGCTVKQVSGISGAPKRKEKTTQARTHTNNWQMEPYVLA